MKQSDLTGQLLLATPSIGDPRFAKTVIFMCSHTESGAMGLVINRPLRHLSLGKLMTEFSIPAASPQTLDKTVLSGGPVETGRGFLLHTSDFSEKETLKVTDQFGVTGTLDALKLAGSGQGPRDFLFILGYSGWAAGQLEGELSQNAWLLAPAEHDLLFGTEVDDVWDRAYARLGVDPDFLMSVGGRA